MKKTKLAPILQAIALLWVCFSFCIYFFQISFNVASCRLSDFCVAIGHTNFKIESAVNHRYFWSAILTSFGLGPDKSHVPGPIWFIVIGIIFLFCAYAFYERVIEKRKKLNLNLTPFFVVLIFTVFFTLIYSRWISFYKLETPSTHSGIFVHYLSALGIILGACFVSTAIGKRLKALLMRETEEVPTDYLREFLFSAAFGLMVIILCLYFLGLFNHYNFRFVLSLVGLLLLLSWREAFFWIKTFFTKKFSLQIDYFSPFIFLAILSLIFMAQNLVQLIRSGPIGFDDLNVYINNAHLMAGSGKLVSGAMSYYWELFSGLGFVIFKNAMSALILCSIGSLLSFLVVYHLVSNYCKSRLFTEENSRFYAMLASTIWITLPLVVFPSAMDMKVDLIGMFFAVMAFVSFREWKEKSKALPHRNRVLYLSAFLAGFAAAIKYTNLLMLAVLVIYLVWTIYLENGFRIRRYIIVLVFIGISLLPVLPISLRNIYQTHSLAVVDVRFGQRDAAKIKVEPAFGPGEGIITNFDQYMRERRVNIETDRYLGYNKGIIKYLLLPFRITSNSLVYGPYINIGYIFLAFLPLAILFFRRQKKMTISKTAYLTDVAILGIVFWLFWMVSASGIIWYGFAGFGFLLILLIEVYHQIRQSFSRAGVVFVNVLIILWLFLALTLRLTFLPVYNILTDRDELRFARGEITASEDQANKFQPYLKVINQIDEDILKNRDNPPKVYLAGTFYRYFIVDNDKTVFSDPLYDAFAYAYQDKDDTKTLERFKSSGIKYMIISRWMGGIDHSPGQRLTKQNTELNDFLQRNAKNFYLLSDPRDDKVMIVQLYD